MRKRELNRRDFIQKATGAVGATLATGAIQLNPLRTDAKSRKAAESFSDQDQPGAGERTMKVWIPMRDGVKLSARIFLPGAGSAFPVVLQRTPYNKEEWVNGHEMWTQNGYVYVVQDCRGRFESEGEWWPFFQEKNDGYDTLAWIHQQAWCNGDVGMFGPSYMAYVQYAAMRAGGAPLVKSLIPTFMAGDHWVQGWYDCGALSLFTVVSYGCGTADHNQNLLKPAYSGLDLGKFYRQLPLMTLSQRLPGCSAPFFGAVVTHNTHDDYWKGTSLRGQYGLYKMPVFMIDGWYDHYASGVLSIYQEFVKAARSRGETPPYRVVIGPWGHHHALRRTKAGEADTGCCDVDFGPEAPYNYLQMYLEWFDRTLKGTGPPPTQGAPIRIFVMGANKWRDENEWPLARTQYVNFYLHSGGNANTLGGDGTLSPEMPEAESLDTYTYDPADPAPTHGANEAYMLDPAVENFIWAGPSDQRSIERRKDVLCYTSAPLKKDMEVTGPIVLKLYAASSARDTDFVGRLVDVYPDGLAINLTAGIVRARFREEQYWESPQLIDPGKTYEYKIDLLVTSNVFKKGHRIRLDVTSSDFPRWDRNLNTGHIPWLDTEIKKAEQSIYHNQKFPSHLILPIIPYSAA